MRVWIRRSDGVLQRYHVSHWRVLVERGYRYNRRGRYWFKPRPPPVRPPPPPPPRPPVVKPPPPKPKPKPERKPPREFWRFAYGIKLAKMGSDVMGKDDVLLHVIPVHTNAGGRYYGAIIYAWLWEKDPRVEDELKEILLEEIERFVGYDREEWGSWIIIDDGWGWMKFDTEDFPEAEELVGKYEWRIEDDRGRAVSRGGGRL